MEITESRKGKTFKSAIVTGTTDKEAAFQFVLDFFGEKTVNIFGWVVNGFPEDGNIEVILYTD